MSLVGCTVPSSVPSSTPLNVSLAQVWNESKATSAKNHRPTKKTTNAVTTMAPRAGHAAGDEPIEPANPSPHDAGDEHQDDRQDDGDRNDR